MTMWTLPILALRDDLQALDDRIESGRDVARLGLERGIAAAQLAHLRGDAAAVGIGRLGASARRRLKSAEGGVHSVESLGETQDHVGFPTPDKLLLPVLDVADHMAPRRGASMRRAMGRLAVARPRRHTFKTQVDGGGSGRHVAPPSS